MCENGLLQNDFVNPLCEIRIREEGRGLSFFDLTVERKRNIFTGFEDFRLKMSQAKARIWLRLS